MLKIGISTPVKWYDGAYERNGSMCHQQDGLGEYLEVFLAVGHEERLPCPLTIEAGCLPKSGRRDGNWRDDGDSSAKVDRVDCEELCAFHIRRCLVRGTIKCIPMVVSRPKTNDKIEENDM